jgi:ABC-type uncharacterized transport system substrate-binding protein
VVQEPVEDCGRDHRIGEHHAAAVEMVINLKSAKSLDLSIPPFLLARANRVVD